MIPTSTAMSTTIGTDWTPVSSIKRSTLRRSNPARRSRHGATKAQYRVTTNRREILARWLKNRSALPSLASILSRCVDHLCHRLLNALGNGKKMPESCQLDHHLHRRGQLGQHVGQRPPPAPFQTLDQHGNTRTIHERDCRQGDDQPSPCSLYLRRQGLTKIRDTVHIQRALRMHHGNPSLGRLYGNL